MYSSGTLKTMNCNHDISLYFKGEFVKDDYCNPCLDSIAELESESVRQEESIQDTFKNSNFE